DPLLGYTVWNMTSTGEYVPVGQAPAGDTEWSTVLFAAEPTDLNLAVTATYGLPGIFQLVNSDPAGPVALTIALEDNPNNLTAMDYGDDVHLMWDPPVDASQMELSYHDGTMVNAYNHSGVVATRFRVSGTYAINGLANAYWTGGWPDATIGEVPITLSVHPVDPATDMPGEAIYAEEVYVDADPTSESYGWAMTSGLADNPLVVTGDVYFAFSNFTNDAGTDTDVMGCDAVLDFPGNRYSNVGNGWELDALSGSFANCGDWMMYMHADFTAGDVGLVSSGNNGQWIDQLGASSIANLPANFAEMEAASTKENLVELEYPALSNPVFASHSIDRDMMHYNIYRDGVVVGDQQPGVHEYMDGGLDWGTYTYHVTAMYDDHESIATNSVEVTLSNVPPDAVMLISPGDGLEVEVTEDNMEETVAFIWTAANDADNDLVEYYLGAWTEVAAGDTAWNVLPDTPVGNDSFEEATQQDAPNDWQYLPDGWEGFPNQNSQTVQFTGDGIFGSEDLFEAYDGDASVKLWGLYDGNNTENNIFQTWYDGMLAPGTEFSVEAAVMSHAADWIGNGGNSLVLFAKYFTADWGWVGMDASMPFNGNYEASEWHYLEMDAVVPEGASTVQVGAMLIQPTPDDHGSVYMDDFYMHIPMTTTGLFVSYGDLADGMLEAGVSDLTWTWDIWASDGFEFTPSMSGPRELHINISNLLGLENVSLPKEFALHNNYPNPFNPVTNIVYDIPEATDVTLEIYNVMGQRVRTLAQGNHEPGRYQIVWNATNDIGQALSSGMYIYRIQAGDFVSIKKLVLMK
ncbi:MAG: T9SS type A sorting domain-containing protein, partial [Candidatus Neomarinimicrobiota bacterium]